MTAILGAAMAWALGPGEFPSWRAWWAAAGGSTQAIVPIAAAFSVFVGARMASGEIGAIHASAALPAGQRRLAAAGMIWALTAIAYLGIVAAVATAAAVGGSWSPTLSWWLLLPPVALPLPICVGLVLGEVVRHAWVSVPFAAIVYVVQLVPSYFESVAADVSAVQQPSVGPWTVESSSSSPWLLGWWLAVAAVTLTAVRLGLGRIRDVVLLTAAAVAVGFLATPVSAQAQDHPYFFRKNDPTVLRCHQPLAGVELCIHPAYLATVTTDLDRLVEVSSPRLRLLGFPVARYSQVPSPRLSDRAPRTIYFEVYQSSPANLAIGMQDGFRLLFFQQCADATRRDAPVLGVTEDWLVGRWPNEPDQEWPIELQRELARRAVEDPARQAQWLRRELSNAGCSLA